MYFPDPLNDYCMLWRYHIHLFAFSCTVTFNYISFYAVFLQMCAKWTIIKPTSAYVRPISPSIAQMSTVLLSANTPSVLSAKLLLQPWIIRLICHCHISAQAPGLFIRGRGGWCVPRDVHSTAARWPQVRVTQTWSPPQMKVECVVTVDRTHHHTRVFLISRHILITLYLLLYIICIYTYDYY